MIRHQAPARPGQVSPGPPPYAGSISPADIVTITYLSVIALLACLSAPRVEAWWLFATGHALAIAAALLLVKQSRRAATSADLFSRSLYFLRSWYPTWLIPCSYMELGHLIPRIHPQDFDWELAAIDYRIFGAHPTVWLEQWTTPLLTEIFQIAYVTYYFWPIVLGAVLWRKGWLEKYHFWVYIVVLGFYASYLGYIAVPAIGPRFILQDQQTFALKGVLLFDTIRPALDRASGITRDCFPSGHTEVTLLVLYYAWTFHRRTFWFILPACAALIISTVYLRYHYVIDVVAGALLALLIILVAKPLYLALSRLHSKRHGEKV